MQLRNALIVSSGLALAGLASALPLDGTYTSTDNQYTLVISTSDPYAGNITGTYSSAQTPIGPYSVAGEVGHFSWVYSNSKGQAGVAPFSLNFGGEQRPDGWAYDIHESWNGAYLANNTIKAAGTRSYVGSDGAVLVVNLGTKVFTLR